MRSPLPLATEQFCGYYLKGNFKPQKRKPANKVLGAEAAEVAARTRRGILP